MSEPVSEASFNALPRPIQDWIHELGWKREDVLSIHIWHGDPMLVKVCNMQKKKKRQKFVRLGEGAWQKV